jgi:hypothetical protein
MCAWKEIGSHDLGFVPHTQCRLSSSYTVHASEPQKELDS